MPSGHIHNTDTQADTQSATVVMSSTEVKIKAVQEWNTSQDVKDVRSFLGFASYYQLYVHQFAEVAHPLIELTKKGVEWQWGMYQKEAFR